MPNHLRFDFIAFLDTPRQIHRFDLNVPAILIGPLPDDVAITSRVLRAIQADLRRKKWAFTLLSSRDFSIGDDDPERVWNDLLARWMRTVESSPHLSSELPRHLVQKLARMQWDVRDRTLITGMWPTAMAAWDWVRREFEIETFPMDAPVPVQVWTGAAAQTS